jgi:hypothetical protein
MIGPRVMWEREIGHSELRRVYPQPLSTFCIRATRQGSTTISWLVSPIRTRDQTVLILGLMPLDTRWDQSNTVMPMPPERFSYQTCPTFPSTCARPATPVACLVRQTATSTCHELVQRSYSLCPKNEGCLVAGHGN